MDPGFCSAHGGICEKVGKIDANTEHLCVQMKDHKQLLEDILHQQQTARVAQAKEETKSGLLYWGIASGAMAAISAITHFVIRKICGE
jgi:hypothetical protein